MAASFLTDQRVQQLGAMHVCFGVQAVLHRQEQQGSMDHAEGKLAPQALTPKQLWHIQLELQLPPLYALMAAEATSPLPVIHWQVSAGRPTCASCLISLLVSCARKRPSKGTTTSWLRPKPLGCWAAAEKHGIRCWPKQTHSMSSRLAWHQPLQAGSGCNHRQCHAPLQLRIACFKVSQELSFLTNATRLAEPLRSRRSKSRCL